MNKKGDVDVDELIDWTIFALVVVIIGYLILLFFGKGSALISLFKRLIGAV